MCALLGSPRVSGGNLKEEGQSELCLRNQYKSLGVQKNALLLCRRFASLTGVDLPHRKGELGGKLV
jgi:hypothetical protein